MKTVVNAVSFVVEKEVDVVEIDVDVLFIVLVDVAVVLKNSLVNVKMGVVGTFDDQLVVTVLVSLKLEQL
jgi:hypothetical protein